MNQNNNEKTGKSARVPSHTPKNAPHIGSASDLLPILKPIAHIGLHIVGLLPLFVTLFVLYLAVTILTIFIGENASYLFTIILTWGRLIATFLGRLGSYNEAVEDFFERTTLNIFTFFPTLLRTWARFIPPNIITFALGCFTVGFLGFIFIAGVLSR